MFNTSRLRQAFMSFVFLLLFAGCGGPSNNERINEQMREYVDKCIIEIGPRSERNNATDYCYAKWRQSQREK